jgi:hypothetical protein
MSRNMLPQKPIKLAGVIPVLLLTLAGYPPRVQAQVARSPFAQRLDEKAQPSERSALTLEDSLTLRYRSSASLSLSNIIANTPIHLAQDFPDEGDPKGRRRGGTSRGESCPKLKTPITALVPGEETSDRSFLASTVAEYPTFWVYVPEFPANLRSGEFVLQDEEGNDVFRTAIPLPGKPGAIAIGLPPNPQYALKQNSKYHWFFRVYCGNPQNQTEYFFVDAWVQRVALTPDLQRQLETAKPREYTAYAAHKVWYDAVTNLAELRRTNPGDRVLTEEWTNLLKAVGLEELAQAPIVQTSQR